jgi:hypothetical protein
VPWYAFDAYHTGNPLWPLFTHQGKPEFTIQRKPGGIDVVAGSRQATLRNFLLVYVDFIRYPARFDAELNLTLFPLIVIWPLAWIVAVFNRSVRWWVVWALGFTGFWFLTISKIRYWMPVLPMAGLALCEAIQWILDRSRWSAILHNGIWVIATVLILVWTSYNLGREISIRELPPATPEAREEFLSRLDGYAGVKYVNAHADKTDTVCVLRAVWLNYYFNQRVINDVTRPAFRWPDDQPWIQRLDSKNVQWIVISLSDPGLNIPKQNPVVRPFWPDYQIVYADHAIWVFRHKPIRP